MKTFFYYLKIYFRIVSQYIKSRMQYRADFFVGMFGIVVSNIFNIIVIFLIFTNIPKLGGWTYNELLFFYAFYMLALTPQQLFFDTFWFLPQQVRSGDFIKYYFRPLNMLFYFTSTQFDIKGIIQALGAVVLFVYAAIQLQIQWSFFKIVFMLITWFSASLIMISLVMIGLSSSFWIINAHSFSFVLMNLRDFGRYPISMYNKVFQFVFTFIIPVAFIAFYPSELLLKPVNQVHLVAYFSPIAGIALFALAVFVWKKGTARYSGTGS